MQLEFIIFVYLSLAYLLSVIRGIENNIWKPIGLAIKDSAPPDFRDEFGKIIFVATT